MNKPIKGDGFRRGQYAHVMFQASANDVPDMRIKVNEGSFWVNNKQLVEFNGGQSPVIEAPLSGAKWVLVAINKLGKIVLYNGHAVPNNPDAPYIDKNVLPIAFVYIKSSTKVITNDMIYDARPLYAAGGYPEQHNLLDGRDAEDCHPIQSITGLQEALDNRLTLEDADQRFYQKADSDGTTEANFVLNKDDNGTPVEYCGIRVNRGAQPQVGLRYNEDVDQWQYTNDGTTWHPFGNDVDLSDLATQYSAGITQLSVDPVDTKHPIAVGDNDPRLAEINKKVSKDELKNTVYTKTETDKLLKGKANVTDVYNKEDAENIFMTKADFSTYGGYTKDQLNSFFNAKANASSVYTKSEVVDLLSKYYTKDEVEKALNDHKCNCCGGGSGIGSSSGGSTTPAPSVDLSKYYTSDQVNDLIDKLEKQVYKSDVLDTKFNTITTNISTLQSSINNKANATDVYNKSVIDAKFSALPKPTTVDMTSYYTKSDVNLLLADKADINHGHTASQISQDSNHRFVTDDEITAWNNKADALGYTAENTANKGVANGYASLGADGKVPQSQLPPFTAGVGSGGVEYLGSFAALNAIAKPDVNKIYVVLDASDGDSTVQSGWAEYVYHDSSWLKIAEKESMDVAVDWTDVQNKPTNIVYKDDTIMSNLAHTGTTGDVYTKTEVDNKLAGKSDTTHTHDGIYVKPSALANYVKTDDSRLGQIHAATTLGTKTVDETGMKDGYVLTYSLAEDKLVYKKITSASATTGRNSNDNVLGSKEIEEPTTITDGASIVYDKTKDKLVYKKLHESNQLGNATVDETDIGKDKYLAHDGKNKLVYKSLPTNLLDIDNTDIADGKVLAYDSANQKLKYVALPSNSGSSSSGTSTGSSVKTYDLKFQGGTKVVGKYRAGKENAVKVTKVDANNYQLLIDRDADLRMLQFVTDTLTSTTLHFKYEYTDGTKPDVDNIQEYPVALVSYIELTSNLLQKTTSSSFDDSADMTTYKITALHSAYPVLVKFVY